MAPAANAATVPVHVTLAVSDPAGPNNGITLAVPAAAPGQVMPVANESVTVTFAKNDVPVFDTTNVTGITPVGLSRIASRVRAGQPPEQDLTGEVLLD